MTLVAGPDRGGNRDGCGHQRIVSRQECLRRKSIQAETPKYKVSDGTNTPEQKRNEVRLPSSEEIRIFQAWNLQDEGGDHLENNCTAWDLSD